MTAKVTQLPCSPREDPFSLEGSPFIDIRPPLERETNTVAQGELDHLRESFLFPAGIKIRLPAVDETIVFTHLGEVAFYEVTFQSGLHLPIHPTMKRILQYYNIYPAQLDPNVSHPLW